MSELAGDGRTGGPGSRGSKGGREPGKRETIVDRTGTEVRDRVGLPVENRVREGRGSHLRRQGGARVPKGATIVTESDTSPERGVEDVGVPDRHRTDDT